MHTQTSLAARVRAALGMPHHPAACTLAADQGETATRVIVWSVRELQDVYARVSGTLTAHENPDHPTVLQVTVTANLPDIGEVQAFTDWEPSTEPYGADLPVIAALVAAAPATC